jgi:hypothetical protein
MADLTITAASVVAGDNAVKETKLAGATITAGQPLYVDAASGKFLLADSDSATALAKTATHIALNGGALNQPITGMKSGDVTIGATLTAGATYFLSNTAGGICPDEDVGAGENVCQIGIAKTTAVLSVRIVAPGVSR